MNTHTPFEHRDVIIIGAGISGLGAACHLQRECPTKDYIILQARDAIGGTWNLFRYPGIRSDSDLYTYGYDFKPWWSAWRTAAWSSSTPEALAKHIGWCHFTRVPGPIQPATDARRPKALSI